MAIAAHFDSGEGLGASARAHRRRLYLETRGVLPSGGEAQVSIHNFSETGVLLETGVELEIGEVVDIALPEAGPTPARIVWASGALYGCAFLSALPPAVLSAASLRSAVQAETGVLPEPPQPAGHDAALGGESLGERIHRLRKLRGLTQGELANRLGVSKPTVWAWEQGRARPIEERMSGIAEALGVAAEDLRPDRFAPGLAELIARCRDQIAAAVETAPEKVRIMIEL
ncbi:helix-turn-helix domain-containing protein [Novosphingobium sp. 1949]|uniref:Helix-turn-helix domain-containing protein n=1 Tax=Novosphingobium organovorum TaxID=2930092 RepID=A0ABT0BEC6_9SPHN|nr:helix-turn-helix domain-containing protein [Novosphingobium organovorum]MCJ2183395.1 helix-turn-helix domain-containing protein [Novosphingobium organovorum]